MLHAVTRSIALYAVMLLTIGSASVADLYPSRLVRTVVAFVAGGSADINARVVGQFPVKELDGSFIIENKGAPAKTLEPPK
jgi:tripartite-type tricarboxylate transporter receptor subunit TctC